MIIASVSSSVPTLQCVLPVVVKICSPYDKRLIALKYLNMPKVNRLPLSDSDHFLNEMMEIGK